MAMHHDRTIVALLARGFYDFGFGVGCTHTWKVGAATVHMVGFASVASATSATP